MVDPGVDPGLAVTFTVGSTSFSKTPLGLVVVVVVVVGRTIEEVVVVVLLVPERFIQLPTFAPPFILSILLFDSAKRRLGA